LAYSEVIANLRDNSDINDKSKKNNRAKIIRDALANSSWEIKFGLLDSIKAEKNSFNILKVLEELHEFKNTDKT
jgi:hypothetical protein